MHTITPQCPTDKCILYMYTSLQPVSGLRCIMLMFVVLVLGSRFKIPKAGKGQNPSDNLQPPVNTSGCSHAFLFSNSNRTYRLPSVMS